MGRPAFRTPHPQFLWAPWPHAEEGMPQLRGHGDPRAADARGDAGRTLDQLLSGADARRGWKEHASAYHSTESWL